MRKKIVIIMLSVSMILSVVGCGQKEEVNTSTVNNTSVDSEDEVETDKNVDGEDEETISALDILDEREEKLTGYTIITPYVQVILTSNGTVLAKGENMYGQLGNGERADSETWTEVKGLKDIVGIYSLGNIGNRSKDESGFGHCYALNSSGELYRWGGNILVPEKVTAFSKIKEIRSLTSNDLLVKCESGVNYIIIPRHNLNLDDSVYSYETLPDTAELYGYGHGTSDGYLLYYNDELSYIGMYNYVNTKSFDQISRIEDKMQEPIRVDITEKIKDIIPCGYDGTGGATLITDRGSVIGVKYRDGEMHVEDRGGAAIIKASLNYTDFSLNASGVMKACGDNEYGQLGDGTTLDYDDGFLTVGETIFADFEYYSPDEYCVALDDDYNVWGWGKGFGTTPCIIIETDDFVNE